MNCWLWLCPAVSIRAPVEIELIAVGQPAVMQTPILGQVAKYAYLPEAGAAFLSATIYYPAKTTDLMPSVVIVSGWMAGEHSMAAWAEFFAVHDIVAMIISTRSPVEMPSKRCAALLAAVHALKAEHAREGSPLIGRLDVSRVGVMGWSMGGAGVQLAALEDPSLKCAIALAPFSALPMSSFPRGPLTDAVPTLFLAGSMDTSAPASLFAWPEYKRTRAPKAIVEIKWGDHAIANGPAGGNLCAVAGPWLPCACCCICGALCCHCTPLAPRFAFHGSTGHFVPNAQSKRSEIGSTALAWLKVFLVGDESYRAQLAQRPGIASRFACERIERDVDPLRGSSV